MTATPRGPAVAVSPPRPGEEPRRGAQTHPQGPLGLRRACRLGVLALAVLLALAGPGRTARAEPLGNENEGPTEYEVKAALIEKFLRYVDWPESAFEDESAALIVGVYGEDPFGGAIDRVFQGKTKDGRPFFVRRVPEPARAKGCHVLFVPRKAMGDLERVVQATAAAPLLAIGESPEFARMGGVINFYLDEGRIRFEVNPDEAKRRELFVSSSLLKLARIVRDEIGRDGR